MTSKNGPFEVFELLPRIGWIAAASKRVISRGPAIYQITQQDAEFLFMSTYLF
jgi:hypothetical protein